MTVETVRKGVDRTVRWIQPSGDLGDAIILSSLLKRHFDCSGEKFGIVRCPPLSDLFFEHPAVMQIAAVDSIQMPVLRTDHWSLPFHNHPKAKRAWDRLSIILFGKVLPEEKLWVNRCAMVPSLLSGLPYEGMPIVIGGSCDLPRNKLPNSFWEQVVFHLSGICQNPIIQLGLIHSPVIPGCYNLTGKFSPSEMQAILHSAVGTLSTDLFILHAADALGIPSVGIYSARNSQTHSSQNCLVFESHSPCQTGCLDVERSLDSCPKYPPCIQTFDPEMIAKGAWNHFQKKC